jgi:CxxC motif-containing protein (DUF1111 family)
MLGRTILVLVCLVALAMPEGRADDLAVAIGKRLFERAWVLAPSSTEANDGLGPLFNARSCAACHQGLERTDMHAPQATQHGLVVRLVTPTGAGDPLYGHQIQTAAAPGLEPEARVGIEWQGTKDGLVVPVPRLTELSGGALSPQTIPSLRVAPRLTGLRDIEAVPDATLKALADPDDRDGDGISGRVARLADGRIGRFGWKATQATLSDQTAAAFHTDLGLSTRAFPSSEGDCTRLQTTCFSAPQGATDGHVEISPEIVDAIVAFLRTRGEISTTPRVMKAAASPEAPSDADQSRGADLFRATGCAECHVPALPIGEGRHVTLYSDLLLHDLGEALSSGGPDGAATAREWRTAPLRGLGTAQPRGLLHDGRARTIEEAVRWHAGEAERSRARMLALEQDDRHALIRFLEGL